MNSNLVGKLVLITVIMFGFGYALVPLYEAFCRVTGFGGKTDIIEEAAASSANVIDRDVAVTFTSHTNSNLPWEFKPITRGLDVKIGEVQEAVFYVKNYSDRPITGMAHQERAFILKRLNVFVFLNRYYSRVKNKKWRLGFCLTLKCQMTCTN